MAKYVDRLSCGAVVVRREQDRWLTLMLRAWRNWDFPKGLQEPGEAPLDTVRREVLEETGLDDLHFDWGDACIETGPYNRGKVARYYLARTGRDRVELGVAPELGRPEHHEYRWLTFDEAYDITSPRVRRVVVWARQILGS